MKKHFAYKTKIDPEMFFLLFSSFPCFWKLILYFRFNHFSMTILQLKNSKSLNQFSIFPFSLKLNPPTWTINTLPIRLTILKIASPTSLPKNNFARTAFKILFVTSFILNPISMINFDILPINFILPFLNLVLSMLNSISMKKTLLKLPLISQLLIGIIQLTKTMHFSSKPLSYIRLTINMSVYSFSLSQMFIIISWFYVDYIS